MNSNRPHLILTGTVETIPYQSPRERPKTGTRTNRDIRNGVHLSEEYGYILSTNSVLKVGDIIDATMVRNIKQPYILKRKVTTVENLIKRYRNTNHGANMIQLDSRYVYEIEMKVVRKLKADTLEDVSSQPVQPTIVEDKTETWN